MRFIEPSTSGIALSELAALYSAREYLAAAHGGGEEWEVASYRSMFDAHAANRAALGLPELDPAEWAVDDALETGAEDEEIAAEKKAKK